ncbi:MAG: hypothetical protein RR326_11155, partial [Stenotrophomonas sp.]
MSLGLLAVFAHLGVQAQIAVKDGSSVSRSDAVVNSIPKLGDDTGIYAVFLDKGSVLTLSASPVLVQSPTGSAIRMLSDAPSLIFSGDAVIKSAQTGISVMRGGLVRANNLQVETTSEGAAAIYTTGNQRSTVDVKALTVRSPVGLGGVLSNSDATFDSLDVNALSPNGVGAVKATGGSKFVAKKAIVNGTQVGVQFLDAGTTATLGDANVTATSTGSNGFGISSGNQADVVLTGASNSVQMLGDATHLTGGVMAISNGKITSNAPLNVTSTTNDGGALLSAPGGLLTLNGDTALNAVNGAAALAMGGQIKQTGKLTVSNSKYALRATSAGTIDLNSAARSSLQSTSYGILFLGTNNTISIANTDLNAGTTGIFYNPPSAAGAPRTSTINVSNSVIVPGTGSWITSASDVLVASVKAASVVNGRAMAAQSKVSMDASTWNLWTAGIAGTKATSQTITYQLAELNLQNGSALNATASVATLYDVQAPLVANNSTLNLTNGVVGDVLSVPAYTASASKLLMDVTLNAGDAATDSDTLKVASVSPGVTTITVTPSP